MLFYFTKILILSVKALGFIYIAGNILQS